MISAETRQQRRHRARQERKGPMKPQQGAYKRALAMFKERAEALKAAAIMAPIAAKLALMELAMKLDYSSRGHGRGTPSRRYGNKAGKYVPHIGAQECARRQVQMVRATRAAGLRERLLAKLAA